MMKLSNQTDRIVRLLNEEDPASERYSKLLGALSAVASMIKQFGDFESAAQSTATTEPPVAPQPESERLPWEDSPFPAPTKDLPESSPSTTTISNSERELTPEYVRGLLMEVSQAGTVVQPLVQKYTPEGKPAKFSSIPKSAYPEFVKELKSYAQ